MAAATPLWAHISTDHGALINGLQLLCAVPVALLGWWAVRGLRRHSSKLAVRSVKGAQHPRQSHECR